MNLNQFFDVHCAYSNTEKKNNIFVIYILSSNNALLGTPY